MASYYVYSGAAGGGNGTTWALAYQTLTLAFAGKAAGDVFYVAHDHAESTAGVVTLTSTGTLANPNKIICVNRAGTVPPVSADRRTTGQVATSGNTNILFVGTAHYDGIIFIAGNSGTGTASVSLAAASTWSRFDNCSLRCASTGVNSRITIGGGGTLIEFNNTTVSFSNTSQYIQLLGVLKWRNTASALLGTIPNQIIIGVATRGGLVECIGVDFSAAGSGKTLAAGGVISSGDNTIFRFIDCKLNASVTKSTIAAAPGNAEIDFIRAGATGVNYTVRRHRMAGLLVEELTIVRSGGASDGVTPLSWRIDTTAECNYSAPYECPPIAIWNDTVGSAKTATVEGIWGGGAVPNDDDVWLDLEYLGDASSPQGSFVNDGKANLLATAAGQASSSATWGGSTTKFKLEVTFTAQQRGWVYARVKCAKPSTTIYVDPLVTLT